MMEHDQTFRAAVTLYTEGLFDQALDLVQLQLEDTPDNGRLWELRGLIHRELGDAAAATHALETASLLVPLQSVGRCALAECYAHAGHRELARDIYRMTLADTAMPMELLLRVARGLDEVGDPVMALRACRAASHGDPDSARPYYEMSYYLQRCGDSPHLVEAAARKAISLDPERVQYRVGLASYLHQRGRPDDAYELLKHLDSSRLQEITCRCCLDRLLALFDTMQDQVRCRMCEQLLAAMDV